MNEFWSMIILAVIQGITEWLPVSSSGHLVLFHYILQYPPSLQFDVALHFGTLLAVFVYFGKDITDIIEALLKGKFKSENGKLGLLLIISAIPAAIVGYTLESFFDQTLGNIPLLILGFCITGIFMIITGLYSPRRKPKNITYKDSLIMGGAQAIAIVPSISRSGATIGTGILLGLDRKMAMKFSFLMSIPVIFGANLLVLGNQKLPVSLIAPTFVSFAVGLLTIHFLMKIIAASQKSLIWFGVYSLCVAALITLYIFV